MDSLTLIYTSQVFFFFLKRKTQTTVNGFQKEKTKYNFKNYNLFRHTGNFASVQPLPEHLDDKKGEYSNCDFTS